MKRFFRDNAVMELIHRDNTVLLNRRMCQKGYRANFPAVKIDCITTRIRLTDSANTVDIVCLTSSLLATPTNFKQIFFFCKFDFYFSLEQKENSVKWYRIGAWPGSADYSVAPKSTPQRCEACLCVCEHVCCCCFFSTCKTPFICLCE